MSLVKALYRLDSKLMNITDSYLLINTVIPFFEDRLTGSETEELYIWLEYSL